MCVRDVRGGGGGGAGLRFSLFVFSALHSCVGLGTTAGPPSPEKPCTLTRCCHGQGCSVALTEQFSFFLIADKPGDNLKTRDMNEC